MRKFFAVLLVVMMVASLSTLSGCSSQSNDNKQATTAAAGSTAKEVTTKAESQSQPVEKVKVRVYQVDVVEEDAEDPATGLVKLGYKSRFDKFLKANPDVELEYVVNPSWDNFVKMVTEGSIDVVGGYGQWMWTSKYAQEITDLMAKDKAEVMGNYTADAAKAIEGLMTTGDGKWVGLVQRFQPFVMMYDKRIFDNFKVPYLSTMPTFDELHDKVIKLTGKDPVKGRETYGIGADAKYKYNYMLFEALYANSADPGKPTYGDIPCEYYAVPDNLSKIKYNLSGQNIPDTVKKYFDVIACAPKGAANGEGVENFFSDENNVAISYLPENTYGKKVIDVINGDSSIYTNYGLSYVFANKGSGKGGWANLIGVFMAPQVKDSKVRDAAWKLMKYMASADYNEIYYKNELMPPSQVAIRNIKYPNDEWFDFLSAYPEHVMPLDPSFTTPGSYDAQYLIVDAAMKGITGKRADIPSTLKAFEDAMNKALSDAVAKAN